MNQDPRNNTFKMVSAFSKEMVLHHTAPNPRHEQEAAHRYLDKHAPDLLGMILGHVL